MTRVWMFYFLACVVGLHFSGRGPVSTKLQSSDAFYSGLWTPRTLRLRMLCF